MWAGSRHRDKEGGRRGEREEGKKDFGSIWRWFSHLYDVSLEGWGGMEAGGRHFGDCIAGVPLMSP